MLDEIGDCAGLEAVGIIPVGCGARRPLYCVYEFFIVRGHAQLPVRRPLDYRCSDRQGTKQAEIVHRFQVGSCIQSVRSAESLNPGRTSCGGLHPGFYGEKGLIPRIFSVLSAMLTTERITPLE